MVRQTPSPSPIRRGRPAAVALALAALSAVTTPALAAAACHDSLMPFSSVGFRRELQSDLRGIGITGFGRTQPYRDSTISTLMGSDVVLVVREQDDLAIEIGAEVPLPAEPLELARFNALVAHSAHRFSTEDEAAIRARFLQDLGMHSAPGTWTETTGPVVVGYVRSADAVLAKLHLQKCE